MSRNDSSSGSHGRYRASGIPKQYQNSGKREMILARTRKIEIISTNGRA